jgi:hypothetical protein
MVGRRIGELLFPLAQQQGRYAQVARIWDQQRRGRAVSEDDAADDAIYDINELYVTSDRDFAPRVGRFHSRADKLRGLGAIMSKASKARDDYVVPWLFPRT